MCVFVIMGKITQKKPHGSMFQAIYQVCINLVWAVKALKRAVFALLFLRYDSLKDALLALASSKEEKVVRLRLFSQSSFCSFAKFST